MKRFVACLLALLLPFTWAMASGVDPSFIAAINAVKEAASPALNGYALKLEIAPSRGDPIAAQAFVAADESTLTAQVDSPWLKPFTLQYDAEKGLLLWNGSQWYSLALEDLEDMPAVAQTAADPETLMAAFEKDLPLLMPLVAPAFEEMSFSPAVTLLSLKLESLMENGIFSISGSDLNMVLYEAWLAIQKIDAQAFMALLPQLELGDLYMTLLDEAADLIEDLAEMEFQLKGNLSDNDQGFVSLVMEDFEFTLNYHEDENRDLMVANGTLRIDRTPLTFDATIGNEILLNYQAANAHGTVTAVVLPNGRALSLSGVHYVTRGDGQDNLEGLWSADLAIQENGFILAADLDENYRCFIDFIFQQDPATGLLTYASLGYQDVNQEHLLTLLPIDENGWRLSYTQSQQGQAQGAITLTAAPGTQQLPLKPDTLSTLSLDDAITMLQLGEGAANP